MLSWKERHALNQRNRSYQAGQHRNIYKPSPTRATGLTRLRQTRRVSRHFHFRRNYLKDDFRRRQAIESLKSRWTENLWRNDFDQRLLQLLRMIPFMTTLTIGVTGNNCSVNNTLRRLDVQPSSNNDFKLCVAFSPTVKHCGSAVKDCCSWKLP